MSAKEILISVESGDDLPAKYDFLGDGRPAVVIDVELIHLQQFMDDLQALKEAAEANGIEFARNDEGKFAFTCPEGTDSPEAKLHDFIAAHGSTIDSPPPVPEGLRDRTILPRRKGNTDPDITDPNHEGRPKPAPDKATER